MGVHGLLVADVGDGIANVEFRDDDGNWYWLLPDQLAGLKVQFIEDAPVVPAPINPEPVVEIDNNAPLLDRLKFIQDFEIKGESPLINEIIVILQILQNWKEDHDEDWMNGYNVGYQDGRRDDVREDEDD